MILKSAAVLLLLTAGVVTGKDCLSKKSNSKLFCYYGKTEDVDTCKCSHVILPSDSDVKSIEGLRDKLGGSKILLTVNEFNEGLIKTLKATKVDGLEINLKKLDSKNDITDFISTVRSKLGSDLYLALSVPPKTETLAKYYDFKGLSKNADVFILQTHLLGVSKNVTFHPSRLSGLWDVQNTDSVVDLVSGLGAPLSKLVITAPVQGFKFQLQNEKHTAPGSPAIELSTLTRDELCEKMSSDKWMLERDQDQAGPYIFRNNEWISFEDSMSMDIKAKYSRVRGLAGLALKDLSQDGGLKCGESLLESAYSGLSKQARAPRGAVLQSLEREILQAPSKILDNVQVSPYRISRVIDVEGKVHIIRQDTRTEFACSRQGYFVHPRSCGRFYRCVKFDQLSDEFSVFEFDCPAGLAFDERVEVCVWPGSLPHASACSGSSEIAPVPKERFVCPGEQGYYADPENCRWFFACLDHGKSPLSAYEFRCPYGLVFDEERLMCEWSWLVPKCASGYASGSIHGEEYHYGGLHSNALDVYDGIGSLGAIKLGGLSGPLVQPIEKTYSSLNTGSQIVANVFGVQPQVSLAGGYGQYQEANGNGQFNSAGGLNYETDGNGQFNSAGGVNYKTDGNGQSNSAGGSNYEANGNGNGFGGSGIYIAGSGNQYGQSKESLEGQSDHSLGYHAGADSRLYQHGDGSYKLTSSGSLVLDNSGEYNQDDSGSYKHDTSGEYNAAHFGAHANINADNSGSYKHDSQKQSVYVDGSATYASGNAYYSGSDYKHDTSGEYNEQNSGKINFDNSGSYNYAHSSGSGYNNGKANTYVTGNSGALNTGIYSSGDALSHSYHHSTAHDESGSYKEDHSGEYIHDNSGSYVADNAGNYKEDLSSLNVHYVGTSGSYNADNSGSYKGESYVGNSGTYSSDNSGSHLSETSGKYTNTGSHGSAAKYNSDNSGIHFIGDSGLYNAENSGIYKAGYSGSYNVETSHANSGTYKNAQSGTYNAGNSGSYNADTSGSYHADNSGNYKSDNSQSYQQNLHLVGNAESQNNDGSVSSYSSFTSNDHNQGQLGQVNIIAGGTSGVALTKGVEISQHGIRFGGVEHVTPLSVVSAIPSVTSVPLPTNSGVEFFNGGVVANIPDLQLKLEHPSTINKYLSNFQTYKEAKAKDFGFANYTSFVTSTEAPLVIKSDLISSGFDVVKLNQHEIKQQEIGGNGGYVYKKPTIAFEEKPQTFIQTVTVKPPVINAITPAVTYQHIKHQEKQEGYHYDKPSVVFEEKPAVEVGYHYPKPTIAFEDKPVVFEHAPAVSIQEVKHEITGGYHYNKPAIVFEKPQVSTYQPPTEAPKYLPPVQPSYLPAVSSTPATYLPPVSPTVYLLPSSTPKPTAVYRYNYAKHNTYVLPSKPVVGHKFGVVESQSYHNHQDGYHYEKPTITFEEERKTPAHAAVNYQEVKHEYHVEKPAVLTQEIHKTEGYHYDKPKVVFEERPAKAIFFEQKPAVAYQEINVQHNQQKQVVFENNYQYHEKEQDHEEHSVAYQEVKNTGYHYEKPAVAFEEKPAVSVVQPTVSVQQPAITYHHEYKPQEVKPVVSYHEYQPAVQEIKPAVTFQEVNVQHNHKQEHVAQKFEGYHYEKPAVVFQEVTTVKPTVNLVNIEHKQESYVNVNNNVEHKEVKLEGYHYDKPAVAFEEKPVVYQEYKPIVTVQEHKPAVTYQQVNVKHEQEHQYKQHEQHVEHKFEGYQYEKPAVAFEEKPVVYQEYKPILNVQEHKPAVTYQHVNLKHEQEHTYQQHEKHVEHKSEGYHYEKPAVAFEEKPVVYQEYKPIVNVQEHKPAVTYQHVNLKHEQEHKYQQHEQHVEHKSEGYHYEKPAVAFEEKPVVYQEYKPIVNVQEHKPAVTYQHVNLKHEQEHKYQQHEQHVEHKSEGYHYEKPAVAFEEKPVVYQEYKPIVTEPAVAYQQINYKHEHEHQYQKQEHVEHKFEGYHYEKPAVVFKEEKRIPAVAYQEINVKHEQEQHVQKQEDKFVGYHYEKPAVVFNEATQKTLLQSVVLEQKPTYKEVVTKVSKPAVISSFTIRQPVQNIVHEEKQYLPPVQPTQILHTEEKKVYLPPVEPTQIVHEEKKVYLPPVQPTREYLPAEPVNTYIPQKESKLEYIPAPATSKPIVRYEFSSLDEKYAPQLNLEYLPAPKPTLEYLPAPKPTLEYLPAPKPAVKVEVPTLHYIPNKVVHEEKTVHLPPVQPTKEYLPVEPVNTYLPQEELTLEYLPVPKPTLQHIPVAQKAKQNVVVESYEYSEEEEVSEEPIVAKKTFLTYQKQEPAVGYEYPKPEIKFEEGIRINNYKEETVSTTSKPIVRYEFSSLEDTYNNYEIQKQDYVPVTTLRPVVTSPRRKYKSTTPLQRVYLPVTTETYVDVPVSQEIYKIEPSVEYLPVKTVKPEYVPVTTAKPSKEYLPVTTPAREYLPVTRTRTRKPTTTPSKVYLPVTTEKPSREYLPIRSRTRKPTTAAPSKEYLPVTTVKPSREYLPVTTIKPSREYLPVTSTKPSREYLPVTTVRSRGRKPATTTEPSREYLPVKENVRTRRPKTNSKMIIKVNDFHPVLSAKLGAQCTCVSNTVTLRKKSKKITDDNNNEERENYPVGYVIKDDAGEKKSKTKDYDNYDGNYADELELPKTDVVVEDFNYESEKVSSTTEAIYVEEPSTEAIDVFINKPRKQSVRVIKKKKQNNVKIIEEAEIKEDVKKGIKEAVKEGIKEEGFKQGFKEGVEVAIQSKDFDRYGPGGVRGRTETLQGTIDCQRAGLFRHPKHCNKFYACRWDCDKNKFTLHVFNCPVHLTFDNNLGACNWPSQGPACVDDTLLPSV